IEGRRLTGPRACGSLPEKSKLRNSALDADGDGELHRLVDHDAVAVEQPLGRFLCRRGAFRARARRYSGQGYELRTPLEELFVERLTASSLRAARERFDQRHAQIHGHAAKERPVEVSLRPSAASSPRAAPSNCRKIVSACSAVISARLRSSERM